MKLEGLRVVDASMFLPGPVVTQFMADHGAEVIRIEPPGGEPTRRSGPFDADGTSLWFKATHRGKRSVVLDLKSEEGRAAALRLAAEADVFVEGFRPGVAARLGIGVETLRAANPRLVYCSISAYGQTGPLATRSSHDLGAQAFTGFLSLTAQDGRPPVVPGVPAADMASALTALSAILMALYRRERTGVGDTIDASMYDALLAWMPHLSAPVLAGEPPPTSATHRSVGGSAFYNVYATRDGRAIALTGREPHYAAAFLAAVGRSELLPLALEEPGPGQQRLIAELRALFATQDYAQWCALLEDVTVSWAPVLDLAEALAHPQIEARAMLVDDGVGGRVPGTPLKFADEPGQVRLRPPALDEDGGYFI